MVGSVILFEMFPEADGGSQPAIALSDPLQDLLGTADALDAVLSVLDVPSLCQLACVSSQWRRLIRSAEVAWRERALEIGVDEPSEGGTWFDAVRSGWAVAIGDAFEVMDTYGIVAVARVIATVHSPPIGPLLLLHYEGWSEMWFMWVSRRHDRERIRPLTPRLPGIGSAGAYTEDEFRAKLQYARNALVAGTSVWAPTRGRPRSVWPYPYTQGRAQNEPLPFQLHITQPDWLRTQRVRPFRTCAELAASPADCVRAWCAATLLPASQAPAVLPEPAAHAGAHGADGADSSSDDSSVSASEPTDGAATDNDDAGAEQLAAEDGGEALGGADGGGGGGGSGGGMAHWAVGERIEARDHVGLWYTARVADVRVGVQHGRLVEEVLVHFEGWTGRWDEWHRTDAPTLRRYAGLQRFGPAGSELGGGRWGGIAELHGLHALGGHEAPPGGDGGAVAPPDQRTPLTALLSALARWRQPSTGWADAELCEQLVRLDALIERVCVASPAVRAISAALSWLARAVLVRLARPVLLLLLRLLERLLLRLLRQYARSSERHVQPDGAMP
ncbi:hypothetical protein KFE25_008445 [Diacronema lutheri]|uniref:F-box domain-containing protein n=2 Tax=Diacronema lutheri TaxID=2081491 RepID=A0A8J6C8P0_DIALT|nr:hypothetical protein KFE25_008445 [Diacronema lutheri]